MMRRKLLPFLMMAFVAIMASCVNDDIDDLQGQIDDLDEKVTELEKTQQEALLAEIEKLQATISTLQAEMEAGDSGLADQYASLLANLQLLEEEVANNEAAIYYGNLLTDDDYAAVVEQGATIVTGKIIATTQSHLDAMAALKLVGGNLFVNGGSTVSLPNLQTISGSLMIEGINEEAASIDMSSLASIGDDFMLDNNEGLTTLNIEKLVLVNGSTDLNENTMLTDLNLGNVTFNEDVNISRGLIGNLSLGQINGNLQIMSTKISSILVNSTTIEGSLYMSMNSELETYDMDNITEIKDDLTMEFNGVYGSTGNEFAKFAGLTTIGGNVRINSNNVSTMDSFHSVTSIKGSSINIGGASHTLVSIFNNLLFENARYRIDINVRTDWFDGFNALTNANSLNISLEGNSSFNEETSETTTTPNKVNGFSNLIDCKQFALRVPDLKEFDAFNAFDNFWGSNTKFYIYVPLNTDVDLCSMQPILTKIAADEFGTKVDIKFYEGYLEITDPHADIINNRLIDGCE